MAKRWTKNEKYGAIAGAAAVGLYLDIAYQYHKGIGDPGTAFGPRAWKDALKWPVSVRSDYQALGTTFGQFLELIILGNKSTTSSSSSSGSS